MPVSKTTFGKMWKKNESAFVENIRVEPVTFPQACGTLWPAELIQLLDPLK